jgi:acyl-CoA synthetase (AMP-forming)/AMP-acid ligase II
MRKSNGWSQRIELLEALPRTGSGKLDKRRLKEMFKER